MRNAICFYGYFGKRKEQIHNNESKNFDSKNRILALKDNFKNGIDKIYSIKHFKKYVIENNKNVDIFFHCWNIDKETQELLIKEYKPKKYIFENQDESKYKFDYENTFNIPRFYSEEQSIQLLLDYQKENNIQYNMVSDEKNFPTLIPLPNKQHFILIN